MSEGFNMKNFIYERYYLLAGFVAQKDNSSAERYLVGGKAKDLARDVNTRIEVKSFLGTGDVEIEESLPVKSALYLKKEDYEKFQLEQTGILRDEMYLPPGSFSLDSENVRNTDWDKISSIKSNSLSISLELFLLMERPLKLHYKKEITLDGISLTYNVLERAKPMEAQK